MRAPSLPIRILLNTDGSVTALLEASFGAPVSVDTVANWVDRGLLRRRAILRLPDGRALLRASSVLAIDRLDGRARAAMLGGAEPIGTVLRAAAVETRRELLDYTVDRATADDAAELGIDEGELVYERSYRIVRDDQALADVTERIPASLFDTVPA